MRGLCATFSSMLIFLVLSSCERPPDVVGIDNADIPVGSVPDLSRHRVFITTTREASEELGALYSSRRSSDLGLSSVVVTVPPTHQIGQLDRPTRLPPDPRTEFTIVEPVIYQTGDTFVSEVNRELARRPPGQRSLLVFIHGYNTTTSDAILRLGQFVEDSGYPGVPVLFTWASAAQVPRYVYDLNSALVARQKLKELSELVGRANAERVSILAHSMGTFLTMEGLIAAHRSGTFNRRNRIDHIILASPDIDLDLFKSQIGILPEAILDDIYVLVSKDDGALRISRSIAGGIERVGAADADELDELGVTVIDLSEIDNSGSGSHSKFAGSPEVVRLIGSALNSTGGIDAGPVPPLEGFLREVPIRIFGN